jgi:hypothetical protein
MAHLPFHNSSPIVDVHIVLEHIHAQIFGNDSIKMLESLSKLEIKIMVDSLAMTSFEQKVPHFCKKSTVHKVIKDGASHIDTFVNNEEWDAPGSRCNLQLKEELVTFQATHLKFIDSVLKCDFIAHDVANMVLMESVSWVEGFIVFLGDYHQNLTSQILYKGSLERGYTVRQANP